MKHWIRVAIAIGAIALVGGVGVAAFAVSGGSDPSSTPTVSASPEPTASPSDDPTPDRTRTATASPSASPSEDISGNCDEAEHANDPECQGVTQPGVDEGNQNDNDDGTVGDEGAVGEDISGNCDEAEHANDPECQGDNLGTDDDNSGPGDNSGPNEDDGSSDHGGSGPGIAR